MTALGFGEPDLDRYRLLVNRSDRELQALVEEVVIPESWFFRDDRPFALLADRAAAGWLADPARAPFRALSLPCAGGEEPYSIAIALIDRGLAPSRFRVDAVDVSRPVLETARRAVYTRNAFRSKDLSFRDRHFTATPAGYELSDAVKAAVTFHVGNLLDEALLAGEAPYDVVFCRNLLIYFDQGSRLKALDNLDRLLASTGLLFVGHAERLGILNARFRPVGDGSCFAYERTPPGPVVTIARPSRSLMPVRPLAARPPATLPDRHAGPPALRTPAIMPAAVETEPSDPLGEAARLADQGRNEEAAALCERAIRRGGPSASAFHLLGLIRQAGGDRDEAERCFTKAVYLDPAHAEALLALSLMARRRGDSDAADGFRRRAERADREKNP